jgi:hypothetical protein
MKKIEIADKAIDWAYKFAQIIFVAQSLGLI